MKKKLPIIIIDKSAEPWIKKTYPKIYKELQRHKDIFELMEIADLLDGKNK